MRHSCDLILAPSADWFHLVGLIHDIGKIMALYDTPQWSVVGDTFPVGCAFDKSIVFSEQFEQNPDAHDSKYKYVSFVSLFCQNTKNT